MQNIERKKVMEHIGMKLTEEHVRWAALGGSILGGGGGGSAKTEAEFGALFFSLINAARLYKINPDNALERTNQKFIRRFNYLEEHTIQEGRSLKDMTLEEMDQLWNEAKAKGL